MKLNKSMSILFMIMIVTLPCKKSELKNDPNNLAGELKGSVWSEQLKHGIDLFQEFQTFSVALENDGPLTWTDVQVFSFYYRWAARAQYPEILTPLNEIADEYRHQLDDGLTHTVGTEVRPAAVVGQ